MERIVSAGKHALAMQQRGYALLEELALRGEGFVQSMEMLRVKLPAAEYDEVVSGLQSAVQRYRKVYADCASQLESLYNHEQMQELAQAYLRPWERSYKQQKERVELAQAIHNAAKEAYNAQQNGNILERWSTLRRVRRLAGFKLEKNRVGNFVARSYDLLHDAQMELQKGQLEMFAHNVAHKCNKDLYKRVAQELSLLNSGK